MNRFGSKLLFPQICNHGNRPVSVHLGSVLIGLWNLSRGRQVAKTCMLGHAFVHEHFELQHTKGPFIIYVTQAGVGETFSNTEKLRDPPPHIVKIWTEGLQTNLAITVLLPCKDWRMGGWGFRNPLEMLDNPLLLPNYWLENCLISDRSIHPHWPFGTGYVATLVYQKILHLMGPRQCCHGINNN